MGNVSWIKLRVDMFDNKKIKHIRRLPDGNDILLCWIMLLSSCGKCNANGYVFLTENIPYTPEDLSDEFGIPSNTVKLALKTFEHLNMVEIDEKGIYVLGWEEYQNIEGLDKIREQTRLRVAKHRENNKELACNVTDRYKVTQGNATEEELELEEEEKKEKKIPYKEIVEKYHEKLPMLPKVVKITAKRKSHLNQRWEELEGVEGFTEVFEKVANSDFLTGNNDRKWKADFDWIINENNLTKILEGKYDPKGGGEPSGGNLVFDY